MNRIKLKKLVNILLILITMLLILKIFIFVIEPDFESMNAISINTLNKYEDDQKYSFNVVGNIDNSIDIFNDKIVPEINNQDTDFLISLGNFVSDGGEDKYQVINRGFEQIIKPTFTTVGENEIGKKGEKSGPQNYYKHYGPYNYSFTYNNDLYINIDTSGYTTQDWLQIYLEEQLSDSDKYRYVFLITNYSPLSYNEEKLDKKYEVKKNKELVNIIDKYDIDMVISNSPSYFTSRDYNDTTYITTGGAGGKLDFNDPESNYHYLKINVDDEEIKLDQVQVGSKFNSIYSQTFYTLIIKLHSVIYMKYYNIALVTAILLVIFILIYLKITKKVEYYSDFQKKIDPFEIENKKLKIAMFTDNYFPFIGGVPISIKRLKDELENDGHKVVLYAPKYPGYEIEEPDVFRVELLKYIKTKQFNFPISNIKSKKLNEHFEKGNYDIVHVHHPFWMGAKGKELAKQHDIPVVLTYHTRFEKYAHYLPFIQTIFENILSHKMIKRFAQDTQGIIAPTNAAKEYLENIGVSKPKIVLPTGIDFSPYEKTTEEDVINFKNKFVTDSEILLGTVSRLSDEKNIMFILEAFVYIKQKSNKKVKLVMVGDGPELDNIKQFITENKLLNDVILAGRVEPNEVALYYQIFDIFVYSSLSETQGMVILEAMAGKTPVVAINSSGISDMIIDDYNGYTSNQLITNWSEIVLKLVDDQNKLEMLSNNAYEFATNYSTQKIALQVIKFYQSVLISYATKGGNNEYKR